MDNHFFLWITLYHIVFNTTSLGVLCPLSDRHDRGRDRAGQIGRTEGRDRGRTGAKISKNRRAARREKSFLRVFSDFFKKLFRAQNPCFRLFSPVLRTTTRACVFIIFEKNCLKKFFEKPIDSYAYSAYNRHCQQDSGTPPDSLTGTVPTV